MYEDAWLESFITVLIIVAIFIAVALLIGYIIDSIMKMKIFRLFGTCSPGLAWVPFYSSYLLGRTCNGLNGENIGIFGMRVPNWFYNFGWLVPTFLAFIGAGIYGASQGNISAFGFLGTASRVFEFIYWSSIWSFLFSRLDGRYEQEVRVIAIISAIFGVVGFFKVLLDGSDQVYSLENDMFPQESGISYGDPWSSESDEAEYGG